MKSIVREEIKKDNNQQQQPTNGITLTISSTMFCNGKPKVIYCEDWQEMSLKLLRFLEEANFNYRIKINTEANDQ